MKTLNTDRGFTLIEVLIAIGLAAIIATALYGLLWAGISNWRRMHERSDVYQTSRIVFDRLESDLAHAIPLFGGSFGDLFQFEGDAQHLSFPASFVITDPSQPSMQRRVVGRITYTWSAAQGIHPAQLVRSWQAFVPDENTNLTISGSDAFPTLLTGVTFAYPSRGFDPEHPSLSWDASWTEAHQLPEGLRVDVTLKAVTGESLRLRKLMTIWQGMPHVRPAA